MLYQGGSFLAVVYDVLLVRHGESEANATGRFAYHSWDPHLTDIGRTQAKILAHQLKYAPIQHIVSSPLTRAQETIGPLARQFHLDPVILSDLSEVNLGLWDGERLSDLERSKDVSFQAWRKDPEENPPPGGESILTVGHRVLHTLEDFLTQQTEGLTVAATHADCLKGVLLVVTKASGPAARSLFVPNCGQLFLRFYPALHRWTLVLGPVAFQTPATCGPKTGL